MRVRCKLREIRYDLPRNGDGKRVSLHDIQVRSGVSSGQLSMLEQGRSIPSDKQIPALEAAYGARIHQWYEPTLLVELQRDPEDD